MMSFDSSFPKHPQKPQGQSILLPQKGLVVALGTATQAGSVAVWEQGEAPLHTRWVGTWHFGTDQLRSEALGEVLAEVGKLEPIARMGWSSIAGICVDLGPGSFTGLRVGLAAAKGICLAASVPMWGVCSLALWAVSAQVLGTIVVVRNARRGKVYLGAYHLADSSSDSRGFETCLPAQLCSLGDLPQLLKQLEAAELSTGRSAGWLCCDATIPKIEEIENNTIGDAKDFAWSKFEAQAPYAWAAAWLPTWQSQDAQNAHPEYLQVSAPEAMRMGAKNPIDPTY